MIGDEVGNEIDAGKEGWVERSTELMPPFLSLSWLDKLNLSELRV
jgi:hypothetical protein